MSTKDTLQRFIFENAPVRGEFIHLDETYQTIIQQHKYPPPIRRLLGEALCIAGLLSAIIKFKGRLTVQFRGNGALKLLLAQCDNHFRLRGLVKWGGEPSYDVLMQSLSQGVLVIMLDGGPQNTRYQGIVAWRGNSLIESIEGYFKDSEQLSTKIWLSVNDTSAVGVLLQTVPQKAPILRALEQDMTAPHWNRISKLSNELDMLDILHLDFATILTMLYPEEEIRLFPQVGVKFGCTCSRKRGADAIKILGKEEAEAELRDKNVIMVICDFCNKDYIFDRIDVAKLFSGKDTPDTNTQLH